MGRFGLQRELEEKELRIRNTLPPESNSHLGTGPPARRLSSPFFRHLQRELILAHHFGLWQSL